VAGLVQLLASSARLVQLSVKNNDLNDSLAIQLLKQVASHAHLKLLSLARNRVGYSGSRTAAYMLETNQVGMLLLLSTSAICYKRVAKLRTGLDVKGM
jgi:hypothetical protein